MDSPFPLNTPSRSFFKTAIVSPIPMAQESKPYTLSEGHFYYIDSSSLPSIKSISEMQCALLFSILSSAAVVVGRLLCLTDVDNMPHSFFQVSLWS